MIHDPEVRVECDQCGATMTMEPEALAGDLYSVAALPEQVAAYGWIVRHDDELVFCSHSCADAHRDDEMCAADERRADGP